MHKGLVHQGGPECLTAAPFRGCSELAVHQSGAAAAPYGNCQVNPFKISKSGPANSHTAVCILARSQTPHLLDSSFTQSTLYYKHLQFLRIYALMSTPLFLPCPHFQLFDTVTPSLYHKS